MTTTPDYAVKELKERGWEFNIEFRQGQLVKIIAWRPEWVTSDLYTSRSCTTIVGNSLTDVLYKAVAELW